MFLEKRNYAVLQISDRSYRELVHRFSVVVMSQIATDRTATEVLLQEVKNLRAPFALDHCESRLNLPTEPARMVPEDRNAEATFAVDEADDPLREFWPFLLIVRTGRIVTAHDGHPTERV